MQKRLNSSYLLALSGLAILPQRWSNNSWHSGDKCHNRHKNSSFQKYSSKH